LGEESGYYPRDGETDRDVETMVALYALASRVFGRKPTPASPGVAESGGGFSSCLFNYKFRLYIPFSGLQSSDVSYDVYVYVYRGFVQHNRHFFETSLMCAASCIHAVRARSEDIVNGELGATMRNVLALPITCAFMKSVGHMSRECLLTVLSGTLV
jgi:hypothetical protein